MKKGETNVDKNREKAKFQREAWQFKKEDQINNMTEEELVAALKQKGLPTFGTKSERIERLKKHFGIVSQGYGQKAKVVNQIQKIKIKREERRAENKKKREYKMNKEIENEAMGKKGDVDFETMISKQKFQAHRLSDHVSSDQMKLCVCVRKRPIFKKETLIGENDCVSVSNPELKLFTPRLKVDGITKFLEENCFQFDNTFNEHETTEELYSCSVKPILEEMFSYGMITVFAYGQTGSGKTFTMQGIQEFAISRIFQLKQQKYQKYTLLLSFYEIYGGRCYDLLNNKQKVEILEGNDNLVTIQNLLEKEINTEEEMLEQIKFGFNERTTHCTVHNDTSSRSHAICHIKVKDELGKKKGKFIVCDLAGSERAQDTQSNKRKRRLEGAEINKSLLALKECIRAMYSGQGHIPFRASKLTLALRDSFIQKKYNSRVVMIACICPGSSSADHSVNTLRYADRLKPKKEQQNYNYPKVDLNQEVVEQEILPFDEKKKKEVKRTISKKQIRSISGKKNLKSEFPKLFPKEIPKDLLENNFDEKPQTNYPIPNQQPPIPIDKDQHRSKLHEDLNFMKQTMREERESIGGEENLPSDDFVNFHEKVSDIIDLHDEMLALHLNIIREDAQLLTKESEIISKAQSEEDDYDIDEYVEKIEDIVGKKLHLYKQLAEKIKTFRKALKEEEEMSMKIDTIYY